ncbi:MAG: MBL fold metallo-hydrolase [Acidobacteriota bacterium]|nr:MAG: MBL fold metallo-hydrolase [Acidobacteriota bacterium]
MIVETLVVGPLQVNCYLIGDEETGRGAIVDPGQDAARIIESVQRSGLSIESIIATHGHFDHIGAAAPVKHAFPDAPFIIHEEDLYLVRDSQASAARWGLSIDQAPEPDRFLADGETLKVGPLALEVRHTPGHSPGGVSLVCDDRVFVGDALFQGSVGRTDFPRGSMEQLAHAIRTRLYTLPDETLVLPGHGPPTTIGEEKRSNFFVRG